MSKVLGNFTQQEQICKTCDRYLKTKKIAPQSVCNKLNIPSVPCKFRTLNRFERVLISRRLLVNRFTIMPKGCSLKLNDAVCDIHIETNDIANLLPRGADSNGLIILICVESNEEGENSVDSYLLNSKETMLISQLAILEGISIPQVEGKKPRSIQQDKYFEELAFLHIFFK